LEWAADADEDSPMKSNSNYSITAGHAHWTRKTEKLDFQKSARNKKSDVLLTNHQI
jgi:hypothetical protein